MKLRLEDIGRMASEDMIADELCRKRESRLHVLKAGKARA